MICKEKLCTGCGCCEEICPVKCITMKKNQEGFYYPFIDNKKCIQCGLCYKSCPTNNEIICQNNTKPNLYAVINNNQLVLRNSSSGGFFYLIATYIINNNGVVFASVFNDKLYKEIKEESDKLNFEKATSIEQLKGMMGSKYLQSFHNNVFSQVKNYLLQKKHVLFVGCPCQVAGLYSFLDKLKSSQYLLTVDLICHGVPSQDFFDRYIQDTEKKYNLKIKSFEFRSKDKGWKSNYSSKIIFSNGKVKYEDTLNNPYMICFSQRVNYRESCYNCKFSRIPRIADFTIGDFFGIETKSISNKVYKNGVSAVLLNNEKAESVFSKISYNSIFIKENLEALINTNHNLIRPSKRPNARNNILTENDSIYKYYKKYCRIKFRVKIVSKFPRIIKNYISKIIDNRRY